MNAIGWTDDNDLLADVRAAAHAFDPVPAHLVSAAHGVLGWVDIEAQLAELVADSALAGTAVVRSGPFGPRLLTFSAPDLAVELQITPMDERRDLVGQLAPVTTADMKVRWPGGEIGTRADVAGHFSVRGVPAGPLSIVCETPDGAVVTTSWTSV